MSRSKALVFAAAALVAASPLAAQRTGGYLARQGFQFGIGAGYGSAGVSCEGCTVDRENGLSGNLFLGTALSPRLVLGLETNGFYKKDSGSNVITGQIGISGHYYPSATGNLFIRGSVGMSNFRLTDLDIDADNIPDGDLTASGIGIGLGIGYDVYLGRTASITPYFNYLVALSGDAKFPGTTGLGALKPNLWQVGAAIYFH